MNDLPDSLFSPPPVQQHQSQAPIISQQQQHQPSVSSVSAQNSYLSGLLTSNNLSNNTVRNVTPSTIVSTANVFNQQPHQLSPQQMYVSRPQQQQQQINHSITRTNLQPQIQMQQPGVTIQQVNQNSSSVILLKLGGFLSQLTHYQCSK